MMKVSVLYLMHSHILLLPPYYCNLLLLLLLLFVRVIYIYPFNRFRHKIYRYKVLTTV